MIKKQEFIQKTLKIIGNILEKHLPEEMTLDEMIDKAEKLIKNIYIN